MPSGLLLLVAACSVGPDFVRPEAKLNPAWRDFGDAKIATQKGIDPSWWKAFNDSTLDGLVELATEQNLPLQVQGLRILEARARLGIAWGRYFPQQQAVTGHAEAVGISNQFPFPPGVARHFGDYELGFDAVWEMDIWGRFRRGVESEAAALLATEANRQDALVSVTAEVARTYATIRTFEMFIEQARQNVQVQEQGLHIAEARFKNGATSELDVTQASTLLESTRATVPPLQASLQQSRNALSTLLGQPPGAVEAMLGAPRDIPQAPLEVAVGVPAELLRRRPDIRTAELQAAAQCARIGVAKADLFPSFSLGGSLGLQLTSGTGAPLPSIGFGSLNYTLGPRLNWPFFNYGRIENGVRVEDARFQQLLVTYRETVLQAAREVEDAVIGFVKAQEATALSQNAVAAAQRSVDLSLLQYREGTVDYVRVLDAQRSLLQQQNNLVQARSSVATSFIALSKALGGGWETRSVGPIVPEATQQEMQQRTNWGGMFEPPRPKKP